MSMQRMKEEELLDYLGWMRNQRDYWRRTARRLAAAIHEAALDDGAAATGTERQPRAKPRPGSRNG
jgi:hypothetical protein